MLKYRRSRVFLWLFIYSFCTLFFGLFILVPSPAKDGFVLALLGKLVFGFLSLRMLLLLVDLVLFRQVRLYQDGIFKIWRFLGTKEIKLANASLTTASIPGGRNSRTVCNQDTKWYLRGITGISWCEDLADPKDVKKLNSLLAYLSGRKLQEIERPVTIKRLINEGDKPRSVNGYAFNEDLLNEDPSELEYNRAANMALLVHAFFVMTGLGALLYFVLRFE